MGKRRFRMFISWNNNMQNTESLSKTDEYWDRRGDKLFQMTCNFFGKKSLS